MSSYFIPAAFTPWLRPATPADAHALAWTMRPDDREECRLLSRQSPLEALQSGMAQGMTLSFTHPGTGRVHGMFGLALGRVVWLLADNAMFTDPTMIRLMTRHGRGLLRLLFEQPDVADIVFNLTLARNRDTLRWLQWLGATLAPPLSLPDRDGLKVVPFFFLRQDYQEVLCAVPPPFPSPRWLYR